MTSTRRPAQGPDGSDLADCFAVVGVGAPITVTISTDSGAVFGTPATIRPASSRTVASSRIGIPDSLARRSFRESSNPGLAMTSPVLPLAEFITSSPASERRRARSGRGIAVGPVMTTFVPCTRPIVGSYRPGVRHGHGTRVALSGYARDDSEHATIGSCRPRSSARPTLRRKISARVRTSSRASCAARWRIPSSLPGFRA